LETTGLQHPQQPSDPDALKPSVQIGCSVWQIAAQEVGGPWTMGWQHDQQPSNKLAPLPTPQTGSTVRHSVVHLSPCGVAEAPTIVMAAMARATKNFIFLGD